MQYLKTLKFMTVALALSTITAKPATASPIRPAIECIKNKACRAYLQRIAEHALEQLFSNYEAIAKLLETNDKTKILDQLDELERDIEKNGKMTPKIKTVLALLRAELENN